MSTCKPQSSISRSKVTTEMVDSPNLGAGRATKRRPGSTMGGLPVAESRPQLVGGRVAGERCVSCDYPVPQVGLPWCPSCYGRLEPASFSPAGTVWSSTVVAMAVNNRRPPFGLAYVDLDDGPRVLVHLRSPKVLPARSRVVIIGMDSGDLLADLDEGSKP